ncbi:protein serine/threonine phosphatase [Thioalkalivibrio sp. K90mix]|uniref:PP2C family protein-serine/threonine phosphatase n=1 Tax=Thioalkalivibrio sp. (strain K90mix) TaxID=396595 RepID=UPI000195A801|nr:protein phosphatase 2C domain-containing protein [Thioalkalivibrio sp. K90mix]ADC70590.1 protein serine/threonine phosphatase [Thioalkalivibrio sp. K90mix]
METAVAQEIGGRREQQDAAGVWACPGARCALLVVADGMGGHADGAQAARMAIATAERLWNECDGRPEDPAALLERLFRETQAALYNPGAAAGDQPGTTLVALYVGPERAWWAHCGDSRLYHFEGGRLVTRTRDHTRVQALLDAGEIREEDMATHPEQNQLLQALGVVDPVRVDHGETPLTPDSRFLLCSDGYWEQLSPEESARWMGQPGFQAACTKAAALAAQRGGGHGDNVAIAAWRAQGVDTPDRHHLLAAIRPTLLGALLLLAVLAILFWPLD